jgi:hypothetical protein
MVLPGCVLRLRGVLGTVSVNSGIKTYVSACSHLRVQRLGNDTSSETRRSYVSVIFLRGIASVLSFENEYITF